MNTKTERQLLAGPRSKRVRGCGTRVLGSDTKWLAYNGRVLEVLVPVQLAGKIDSEESILPGNDLL